MTALELPIEEQASPVAHTFRKEGKRLVHEIQLGDVCRQAHVDGVRARGNASDQWWTAYLRGWELTGVDALATPVLRVAELFCGPGGLALGFDRACRELGIPWRSVAAVDQDVDALAIYSRHNQTRFPCNESVSSLVDRRVRGTGPNCEFVYPPEMVHPAWEKLVGEVDVVLAGPPCQGHSNLNNRTRRCDRRNELYLAVPAIAVALGARAVIVENVQAVVHDTRQVVQSTIALLEATGYVVTTGVLKAAALGWPQRRDRFFLVAVKDEAPLEISAVSSAFSDAERSLWWAIHDLEDVDEDGFMHAQPEFSEENVRRINWLFENQAFDLPPSERPDCHKNGTTYNSVYGRLRKEAPAPTITTGFMTPGRGRYIHPTRKRVLTPHEAARLQGFPDTYDFRTRSGDVPSKAQLAKWIGDAVPMPLGYVAAISALAPIVARAARAVL